MAEDMEKNENCLDGMRCPDCGSLGAFSIAGRAFFEVSDDGTEDYSDVAWDNTSYCECTDCHFEGVVADFKESENIPQEILTIIESGSKDGVLDDMVHDAASRDGSDINNRGAIAQIRFLRGEGLSWKCIRKAYGLKEK